VNASFIKFIIVVLPVHESPMIMYPDRIEFVDYICSHFLMNCLGLFNYFLSDNVLISDSNKFNSSDFTVSKLGK